MDERTNKRAAPHPPSTYVGAACTRLAAKTQTFDERLVALGIGLLEISQQAATLVHHLEQAATRMMILVVVGEMLGQVLDACGQQSDLHFRRTGIVLATTVIGDDLAGLFNGEGHDVYLLMEHTARVSPGVQSERKPRQEPRPCRDETKAPYSNPFPGRMARKIRG